MKKKTKKCWSCRKEITDDGKLFCKKCEKDKDARKPTADTLVFYHTV